MDINFFTSSRLYWNEGFVFQKLWLERGFKDRKKKDIWYLKVYNIYRFYIYTDIYIYIYIYKTGREGDIERKYMFVYI